MALPDLKVSGHGMEVTEALRAYIEEKLKKYERLFELATSVEVECTENVAARGVDKDFRVEISMKLPRTVARVEKEGSDLYALVDQATDVIFRKVKRYKDKLRQWEGKKQWVVEEEIGREEEDDSDFITYVPKIVKRKKIEECRPVSEAEAIERMEMMGYDCFLFKSKETGLISMVYRRKRGGYGLVEPCDEDSMD